MFFYQLQRKIGFIVEEEEWSAYLWQYGIFM